MSAADRDTPEGRFEARLPEPADWFDLWHTHVDWRGEGNEQPEVRRRCARVLFDAWEQLQMRAAGRPGLWQSWLVFDTTDAGQDAVYLHTPNPNRDNFAYRFEGVTWGAVPPTWLAEFLTGDFEIGRSEYGGVELYWVRRKPKPDAVLDRGGSTTTIG